MKAIEDLKQAVSDGIKEEKELSTLIDAILENTTQTAIEKETNQASILEYIKNITTVEQLNNLEQIIQAALIKGSEKEQVIVKEEHKEEHKEEEKEEREQKEENKAQPIDNSAALADLAVKLAARKECTKIRQKLETMFLEELQGLKKQNLPNDWLEQAILDLLAKKNQQNDTENPSQNSTAQLKQQQNQETIAIIDKVMLEAEKLISS